MCIDDKTLSSNNTSEHSNVDDNEPFRDMFIHEENLVVIQIQIMYHLLFHLKIFQIDQIKSVNILVVMKATTTLVAIITII